MLCGLPAAEPAMRTFLSMLLAVLPLASCSVSALDDPPPLSEPHALIGTWIVRRSPPPANPESTLFVVEEMADGSFTGHFFNAEVYDAHIEPGWGGVHFSFSSVDGNTQLRSSGVLADGRLRGSTRAVEPGSVAVWIAERAP